MEEDGKIADYVLKVHNLVHLMKGYGENLIIKMIVDKVMPILTSHFNQVIIAIQESNNFETMKLEDLVVSKRRMRLGLLKGKGLKIRYKHCMLRLVRSMMVPTN